MDTVLDVVVKDLKLLLGATLLIWAVAVALVKMGKVDMVVLMDLAAVVVVLMLVVEHQLVVVDLLVVVEPLLVLVEELVVVLLVDIHITKETVVAVVDQVIMVAVEAAVKILVTTAL